MKPPSPHFKKYKTENEAKSVIVDLEKRGADVKMFYIEFCLACDAYHLKLKPLGADWDNDTAF